MIITMAEVTSVSRRVGHVTFVTSARTCSKNSKGPVRAISFQCQSEAIRVFALILRFLARLFLLPSHHP